MPNKKTPQEKREVKPGVHKTVRYVQRDRAVELFAQGWSVAQVGKELNLGRNTLYRWLKEPDFIRNLEESRELLSVDAINRGGQLVELALDNVVRGLRNDDTGQLGAQLLDKMGILRTTGSKLGMQHKADNKAAGVVINLAVDGNGLKVIDAESDHFDTQNIEAKD